MTLDTLKTVKKVIGAKQALKAIERDQALKVFLGSDADNRVVQPIREMCQRKGIEVDDAVTMAELGKACGIEVSAAAVAVTR